MESSFTRTGGIPLTQRPVTQSAGVSFDLRLNKRLSKQSKRRWNAHYYVTVMFSIASLASVQ